MRNIRIADRKDWVLNAPAAVPPRRRSRAREWLATLPIVLLLPALIVPYMTSAAGGTSIRVTTEAVAPGERVTVVGEAFAGRESGDLAWAADDEVLDGKLLVETIRPAHVLASYKADGRGSFTVKLPVSRKMRPGSHLLVAIDPGGVVRASVMVEVAAAPDRPAPPPAAALQPVATPTARPTATPTARPTAAPTAAPIATPTATPSAAPTDAPTAVPTDTPAPTATDTTAPTSTPTPTAAPTPTPTTSSSPTPTPTPTTSPSPTPTPSPASSILPPVPSTSSILVSTAELTTLPTSGAAWTALKAKADLPLGTPNISNQDDNTEQQVLAKAFVFARTGQVAYRTAVLAALKSAVNTELGGRTLALGRNLPAYVIAADLVSLRTLDPAFDQTVFRPWLRSLLTETLDGKTLRTTHELRPNNWGTHAGAARAAIAGYLGDAAEMARVAQVFRGWLGDRTAYAGFAFGDLSWQCDASKPVAINPTSCMKGGIVIDGALPEEMRRGGVFQWPPVFTGYAWEALQGAVLQAELLRRAGYDAWTWSDRALLRSTRFLYGKTGWAATGDDEWQPWLIDRRYGTSFRSATPAQVGKNFGYTDWVYAP